MLDTNTNLIAANRDAAPPALDRPLTLRDLLRFVQLRRYALLVPTVLALGLAYGYLQVAVPVYSARTQLIIDARLPQFIPGHNEDTLLAWDSAQVESEIAVLSSERIAGAVVTKLGLDRDKDFRAEPGPLDRLRALIGLKKPDPRKRPDRFREALDLIQDGLSVRRAGLSYAIDITFSFPDAFRTSEIANGIAEAYIADQLENRSHAARVGGDWLQDRMVFLRSQMNAASKAVQVFRASHNYAIPDKDDADAAAGAGGKTEDRTLDELEANASTYRRIFESFLQSYTESVQRQSFPVSDARILTPASLPENKSAPRTGLIYALAGLIGLLSGTGVAVFRHNTDRVVRRSHDISDQIALDDLGQVPRLRPSLLQSFNSLRMAGSPRIRSASLSIRSGLKGRAVWFRPRRMLYFVAALEGAKAPLGGPFFAIRTLIDLARRREQLHAIGITGPNAGNGSSTLASNLGSLAAACGTRTLVIDADVQRRSLSVATRSAGRRLGLLDVLSGTAAVEDAVVRFAGTPLDVLPLSGGSDADAAVLTQDALERLLVGLRETYALVIVDLPPLFPIGASLELSAVLDGVVLTVEAGRTTIDLVSASVDYLARVHARTLGFVLNKSDL